MLNIFLLDQRPVIRSGIRYLIEHSLTDYELHDFTSIQQVSSRMDFSSPNLFIIGLEIDSHGPWILFKLKKMFPDCRFVMYDLSTKADGAIKYLRSGAHGYLSKNSDIETLRNCIQTVMAGKFYIDPRELLKMLDGLVFCCKTFSGSGSVRRLPLTQRQNEIAILFAQGMSTSKIARKLGLSSSTISTVKMTIYDKLKIDSVVDLREAMLWG
jgi:DNA-binding NarL/FixJ family response regulator